MLTLVETLPALLHEVLQSLTHPDPSPRSHLDNPLLAIARRLPHLEIHNLLHAVKELNARGLTRIPVLIGMVSASVTENPRDWVTAAGQSVLAAQFGRDSRL